MNLKSRKRIMKRATAFLLAVAMTATLMGGGMAGTKATTATAAEKTKRVFVELKASPASVKAGATSYTMKAAALEEKVLNAQDSVVDKVEDITGENVINQFGYLINGFSIQATDSEIVKIKKLAKVASVSEVGEQKRLNTTTSAGSSTQKLVSYNGEEENFSLDDEYDGTGMVVAVIDTGVDYTHKDFVLSDSSKAKISESDAKEKISELGYGTYCSDKVPFAYNYMDSSSDLDDVKSREASGDQHGMHVAGIIGANGGQTSLEDNTKKTGTAKEAQILNMNVFGTLGGTIEDVCLRAIEDSVKLDADVINMSLGSMSGSKMNKEYARVIKNATDMGTQVVVAASNSGYINMTTTEEGVLNENGVGSVGYSTTLGTPAGIPETLTAASSDGNYATYNKQVIYNDEVSFSYDCTSSLELDGSYEIVDCGFGSQDELKILNLKGKVALIQRGKEMTFLAKAKNAFKNGAVGIIFYDNVQSDSLVNVLTMEYPFCMISKSSGEELLTQIGEGKTFKFKMEAAAPVANSSAGKMSYFSSWGPTDSLIMKPDLTGVGGMVYSTQNDNGYGNMSGTSMASPYLAGMAAVVKQSVLARKLSVEAKDIVAFVKNTEMNTAKVLTNEDGVPLSPRQQGAGFVSKKQAVQSSVIATVDGVGSASLYEIGKTKDFTITLTNYGTEDYTFDCAKSTALYQYETEDNFIVEDYATDKDGNVLAETTLDKSSVTVPAGKTATVKATLKIADGFDENQYVEGYLNFTSKSENQPSLSLPYMGYYGDYFCKEGNSALLLAYDADQDTDSDNDGLSDKYFTAEGNFIDQDTKNQVNVFSPNGDGYADDIRPSAYLTRNAYGINCNIVDAKRNAVVKSDAVSLYLTGASYHTNGNLEDYLQNGVKGERYDTSTGKYEKIADGYYYYEVNVSNEDYTKTQSFYLPLIIDTKAPTASKGTLEQKDGSYFVSFSAEDRNGSGFNESDVATVKVGTTEKEVEVKAVKQDDNQRVTQYEACLDDVFDNLSTAKSAEVTFMDRGGNKGTINCLLASQNGVALDKDLGMATDSAFEEIQGSIDGDGIVSISGYADAAISELHFKNNDTDKVYDAEPDADGRFSLTILEGDEISEGVLSYEYNGKKQEKELRVISTSTGVTLLDTSDNIINTTGQYDTTIVATDNRLISLKINSLTKGDTYRLVDSSDDSAIAEGVCEEDGSLTIPDLSVSKESINIYMLSLTRDGVEEEMDFLIIGSAAETDKLISNAFLLSTEVNSISDLVDGNKKEFWAYTNKPGSNIKVRVLSNNKEIATKEYQTAKSGKSIRDLYFAKVTVPLAQGQTYVEVITECEGETVKKTYVIIASLKNPSITLENMPATHDGVYYTNQKEFQLKGFGMTYSLNGILKINQEKVVDTLNQDEFQRNNSIIDVPLPFDKTISLKDGENYINIEVIDCSNNQKKETLKVIYDTAAPSKPSIVQKDNVATVTQENLAADEELYYSLDGKTYQKYVTAINLQTSGTLYAKTVDFAGNESDVVTKVITIANSSLPASTVSPAASTLPAIASIKKPAKVKKLKVTKNKSKKKAKLIWKKVSGAVGYQIVYGTKKSLKKSAKKITVKTTSKWITKLKKKNYYFKVRAYKKSGKTKVYGSFSKIKTCSMK